MLRTDDPRSATAAAAGTLAGGEAVLPPRAVVIRAAAGLARRATRPAAIPALLVGLLGVGGLLFLPGDLLYIGSAGVVSGLIGLALFLPMAALREMPLNAAGMVELAAYFFAQSTTNAGLGGYLLGIVIALGTTIGVSVLGGLASLVVTGLYFVVTSLVIQVGIEKVVFSIPGVTGGAGGWSVSQPQLTGWFGTERCMYLIVCVAVLAIALAVRRVLASRAGYHAILVGHVPEGASAVGLRNWAIKLAVFALSGLLIGIAGLLIDCVNGTPPGTQSFSLIFAVIYMAIPLASGMRDLASIWLVAAAFTVIPVVLESYHLAPNFVSGIILLIAILLSQNRDRIGREARRLWRQARGLGADQDDQPSTETVATPAMFAGGSSGNGAAAPARVTLVGVRARPRPHVTAARSSIEGRDITVDFGGIRAVDNVSVRVTSGQRVGIVGANGAGKTTLFNALTGFVPLAQGRVLIDTDDATSWPPLVRARAGIRRTFQVPRLADVLTVEQNVICGHGHDRERQARVEWLLDRFGLTPLRSVVVSALPFGVRREVELVRALATVPRVLMLDEPVSGLEDAERDRLVRILLELQAEEGWGLLAIEHDLAFISAVAQHLLVMEDGKLLVEGPIAEVMRQEQVRRVYLGELVTA